MTLRIVTYPYDLAYMETIYQHERGGIMKAILMESARSTSKFLNRLSKHLDYYVEVKESEIERREWFNEIIRGEEE